MSRDGRSVARIQARNRDRASKERAKADFYDQVKLHAAKQRDLLARFKERSRG